MLVRITQTLAVVNEILRLNSIGWKCDMFMMISQRCEGVIFWKLASLKLLLQQSVGFNRTENIGVQM
jgi:hypothetical protein